MPVLRASHSIPMSPPAPTMRPSSTSAHWKPSLSSSCLRVLRMKLAVASNVWPAAQGSHSARYERFASTSAWSSSASDSSSDRRGKSSVTSRRMASVSTIPALTLAHALEPDPQDVQGGRDDLLARHLGMVAPPDRQAGEPRAHYLRGHLRREVRGRGRASRLAADNHAQRRGCLRLHLAVDRLDLGVAGRLGEEHARRVGVLL